MDKRGQQNWKAKYFEGICPDSHDWARLAAYIDGEGSILINTQKSRYGTGFYLRVTVANTDIRLMVWLKENFGGSYCGANTDKYYEGKNWKRSYHWGTSSHRAAWILFNCLPYFVIKGEQAEIGIQLQESMRLFVRGGRSKILPEGIRKQRSELKSRLLVLKSRGVKSRPVAVEQIA